MANKGKNNRLAQSRAVAARKAALLESKPVALTVKVNHDMYVRLCSLRAIQRRTNQGILHTALHDYLQRVTK
jgi:hypothetical protein